MRFSKILLPVVLLVVSFGLTGGTAASAGISTQQEIDLQKGLVAYWKFDEGEGDIVFDETENHNDAILNDTSKKCSPPKWTEGKIGMALVFDGSDDCIRVSDHPSLDITEEITIAGWVKVFGFGSWGIGLVSKGTNGHNMVYAFWFTDNGDLKAHIGNGTNSEVKGKGEISSGAWYHVAFAYVNSTKTGTFYVNGESQGTQDYTYDLGMNDVVLQIGHRTGDTYFNGVIDELRIWSRSLSTGEIAAIYANELVEVQE